ncbi:cuticle protein 16.5-like [Bacillus rossius redtenbacheri]|uniref:cuticle protein 16.5-like n=1 Tax=Bacillus rossius redtenbacheri TaxID=93214 RepID=UPI002FDD935E
MHHLVVFLAILAVAAAAPVVASAAPVVAAAAPQGCARPAPAVEPVAQKEYADNVSPAAPLRSSTPGKLPGPLAVAPALLRSVPRVVAGVAAPAVAHVAPTAPAVVPEEKPLPPAALAVVHAAPAPMQTPLKMLRVQGATPPPSSTAKQ